MAIIKPNNNTISAITALPAGVGGKVLQVKSATKSDTQSVTGTTFTDVTGLSVSITPSSSSNKIFIITNVNLTGSNRYSAIKILRDSTIIAIGDAAGNRSRVTVASGSNNDESNNFQMMSNCSASFLDSPSSTSAITYKIQFGNTNNSSYISYINRAASGDGDDGNYNHRGISTITVYEIAA